MQRSLGLDIDQDTAKRLFHEGGIFIFLDVPEGTEFGIDMKSWTTGQRFRGVKMIPPGVHYIFYNSSGKMGDPAPRIGFFHNFHKAEVLVKKWDKVLEDISVKNVPEAEVVSCKEHIYGFDNFLGPYPFDIYEKWQQLSANITPHLTMKLSPENGRIRSALELVCKEQQRVDEDTINPGTSVQTAKMTSSRHCKRTKLNSDEDRQEDLLPELIPLRGTALRFTKFPDQVYPEGATAVEITQHCMDSTFVLEVLLKSYKNAIDLVGELEFAYLCFLVGHSLEAFEQWKKLVSLFCTCELAITKHRHLYDAFVSVLDAQIKEIPEEFLADIVTNNNFVYVKLRNFFRAVGESNVDGRLKSKVDRFRTKLQDAYLWDFSHLLSDDEEDAPVIVDLQ